MNKLLINFLTNSLYFAIDLTLLILAITISYAIPFYVNEGRFVSHEDMHAFNDMTRFVIFIPAAILLGSGIYKIAWSRAKVEDFSMIFRSAALCDILLLGAIYIFRAEEAGTKTISAWPASSFIYLLPLGCVFLSAWRIILRFCFEKEFFSRPRSQRMIVVGLSSVSDEVIQRILTNRNPSYQIVATFDSDGEALADIPFYRNLSKLTGHIERGLCDVVIISTAGVRHEDLFSIIQVCEHYQVDYQILPTYLDLMASKSRVDLINFVPILSYSKPRIVGWSLFYKTFFDFSVSLIVLVAFSPIWFFVCLAIYFETPGNPIFSQIRVGRNGRLFKIFKFRTMLVDSEDQGPLTEENDKRITKIGQFLRSWSIDEIPQLLNVLLGQMSIIGPRAVVPVVAGQFDEWERISLNVLPGITGLAQVYGRNRLSLLDKSFLSVYYIRNYSLLLDVKVFLRTIVAVIKQTGTGGTIEAKRIMTVEVEEDLFEKT